VGKSLTGGILRDLIGPKGSYIGSVDGLTEKHTGELEGRLFVQVDEADALFAAKESKLKELDGDTIRIRKMNTDGYVIPNILRKFYTTNENAAFRIAEDERRYFVVRVDKGEDDGYEDSEWSRFLRTQIASMRSDSIALGDIMEFFISRDISKWDPKAPVPRTEDMLDMVSAGESKKDTMASQLYLALSEMGVWAVDSKIRSVDVKMWAQIKGILHDKRGRTAEAAYRGATKTESCSIYMTKDNILEIVNNPKGNRLAVGQLTGDEIKKMLLDTTNKMNQIRSLIDSGKF